MFQDSRFRGHIRRVRQVSDWIPPVDKVNLGWGVLWIAFEGYSPVHFLLQILYFPLLSESFASLTLRS